MKTIWANLRRHPGAPVAAALMLLGGIAGIVNGSWRLALVGVAVTSLAWIPVFLRAWLFARSERESD